MKKIILCLLFSIFILSGCGTTEQQGEQQPDDQENQQEPEQQKQQAEEAFNENMATTNIEIHQNEDVILFDLMLTNDSNEPLDLTFPSGQEFEIVVSNKDGNEVYRYSDGQAFTDAIQEKTIDAGEDMKWHDQWSIDEGIESGLYTANVELKVSKINGREASNQLFAFTKDFQVNGQNSAFRNVEVSGENGIYTVKGEARVFEGIFFYTVEEGHQYLIDETKVSVDKGAPTWSPFTINVSLTKEELPVNGTLTMQLYERSAKNGEQTNTYFVKVDDIQQNVD